MALRGAAVGLLSLPRNEGGNVGTSLGQALQDHREQFHTLRLCEYLDPLNSAVHAFLEQTQALFLQQTGDLVHRQQDVEGHGRSPGLRQLRFGLGLDHALRKPNQAATQAETRA